MTQVTKLSSPNQGLLGGGAAMAVPCSALGHFSPYLFQKQDQKGLRSRSALVGPGVWTCL